MLSTAGVLGELFFFVQLRSALPAPFRGSQLRLGRFTDASVPAGTPAFRSRERYPVISDNRAAARLIFL